MSDQYRRRVGSVRPSHLMFTAGVGALVDLPNFSVLVKGVDDWNHDAVPEWEPIVEPRLLAAVKRMLGPAVKQLRPAPWLPGLDQNPTGPAALVGVPTVPFPGWLRCTACNELAPVESKVFGFENAKPRRPQDARFFHTNCTVKRKGRRPLAVAARFVLACSAGHLDDFPYVLFVHGGAACTEASHPRLRMEDRGGNLGANVQITCLNCGLKRNIREALGRRGEQNLPRCRSRHPHLSRFGPKACAYPPKVLVIGASNQWFAQNLTALAVPKTGASELDFKVDQHWKSLESLPEAMLDYARDNVPALREFVKWTNAELWAAMEKRRTSAGKKADEGYPDLRTPEWEILSSPVPVDPSDDFAIRRDPNGIPAALRPIFSDIAQAERLREVRALVGFTRLDAPDPEDHTLVVRAPLSREKTPLWVPASDVRGEGIFVRVPEDLLTSWEKRVADHHAMDAHRAAYAQFRKNRYSDRIDRGSFDPMGGWPGARYLALHTLSHLLIRTIALECGYNSASLSERIYSSQDGDPRAGILIYTAVPDAEGTLGGLVSLAEPQTLTRLVRRALRDARRCSSDPLCSERLPQPPADFLHGAACHVCLFVSETTCERGNRFLDRRFLVPLGDEPELALYPELP